MLGIPRCHGCCEFDIVLGLLSLSGVDESLIIIMLGIRRCQGLIGVKVYSGYTLLSGVI